MDDFDIDGLGDVATVQVVVNGGKCIEEGRDSGCLGGQLDPVSLLRRRFYVLGRISSCGGDGPHRVLKASVKRRRGRDGNKGSGRRAFAGQVSYIIRVSLLFRGGWAGCLPFKG